MHELDGLGGLPSIHRTILPHTCDLPGWFRRSNFGRLPLRHGRSRERSPRHTSAMPRGLFAQSPRSLLSRLLCTRHVVISAENSWGDMSSPYSPRSSPVSNSRSVFGVADDARTRGPGHCPTRFPVPEQPIEPPGQLVQHSQRHDAHGCDLHPIPGRREHRQQQSKSAVTQGQNSYLEPFPRRPYLDFKTSQQHRPT